LVGDGKAEEAKRELLFRFDGENVAADGFGLFGFVEVAVEFDFTLARASAMPAWEMDFNL